MSDVQAIYKVCLDADRNKFNPKGILKSVKKNRRLLWHGTRPQNLISILTKGLLVNAPFVNLTGRLFGDGLYLSDMYDKSVSYSRHSNYYTPR